MGARTRGFANNVLTSGKIDATDGLTGNLASSNFADATVTNITTLPPAVGSAISSVAGNPAAPVATGKIWYNTSTDTFNIAANLEAWSSASPLNGIRLQAGQFGTQTSSVAAGGVNPAVARLTTVEEYNGSGWSSGTALGTAFYRGGACGTQTTGLIFGGEPPAGDTNVTLEYDGSSWTSGGNMTTSRRTSGAGAQTSANAVGGYNNVNKLAATEEYNGTSWTAGTNMPLATLTDSANGIQTSTRSAGGLAGPGTAHPPSSPQTANANVAYDGTTWTTDTNTPSSLFSNSGSGQDADNYMSIGGKLLGPSALLNTVSKWDGTSWTAAPNIATARFNGQGIQGSSTATHFAGGSNSPPNATNLTEEYNSSLLAYTAAAWASGGALNNARRQATGTGLQTAALTAGGYSGTATMNNTEEYDGSSWTNSPTMPEGKRLSATFGTQTAAIDATGIGSSTYSTTTQSYDGSTWTSGLGAVNTGRYANNCFGTSTAALINGGQAAPGFTNASEEWNGSSWTAGTASSSTKYYGFHSGTQTAGLIAGGLAPPVLNSTEEWNGSSWTSGGNLLYPGYQGNSSSNGTQTSTVVFGGVINGSSNSAITQGYDGSAWSTRPSLGTGRESMSGAGTSSSALAAGGSPGAVTTTEEFTGETSALNVESLTTS